MITLDIKPWAVKRVTNILPAPTICPFCGGPVRLMHHKEVYGRAYGGWPYAYACEDLVTCRSWVGLHPDTNIPLGTLANADLRQMRVYAKESFNLLWKGNKMTRNEAYAWLARQMKLDPLVCHIGWFDEEACLKAIEICDNRTGGVPA